MVNNYFALVSLQYYSEIIDRMTAHGVRKELTSHEAQIPELHQHTAQRR